MDSQEHRDGHSEADGTITRTNSQLKRLIKRGQFDHLSDPNALFPPFNDNALQVLLQSSASSTEGLPQLVQQLVRIGVDPNHHNRLGRQALHDAIGHGTMVLASLIDSGAQLDGMKHGDWTPLMLACHKGLFDEAVVLLGAGANLLLRNSDGFTAFHLACQHDLNDRLCLCLLQGWGGAIALTRADNGRSPLFTAAKHGNIGTVREIRRILLESTQATATVTGRTEEHGVSLLENAKEAPEETRQELVELIESWGC